MSSYLEGREARRNGQPREANPHPPGTTHAMRDEGWTDSDKMLRALGV